MFIVYLMTKSNKIEKFIFCVICPLISDKIQIIGFYLSLVRSAAYGESEVKLIMRQRMAYMINDQLSDRSETVNSR
jgi:hypothetical protein